jgi:diguanylate cyclase (GGDEF)-like protein
VVRLTTDKGRPVLRTRSSPSLRRTWLTQTLGFVGVFAVFGGMALAASSFQRSVYLETTSELERSSSALLEVRQMLNAVDDSAAGMMYGLGGPAAAAGHLRDFTRRSSEISAGFGMLEDAVAPAAGPAVERAQRHWVAMDAGVKAAPELLASGAVAEALQTGQDPFKQVWDDLGAIGEGLADVESANMQHMQDQTRAADRLQSYVLPVLLAVMAVALLAVGVGARRMSRRVVAPLDQLRRVALAMRDSDTEPALDLAGASAELQVLAETIMESAASLRISHRELRDQAYTDVLTGLPNRKAFVEELERRFDQPQARLSVLFVDLDDFKVVNDSLGHAAGDELLRVVAQRLRSAVRAGDLVARLGGDEFAVLVSCHDDAAAASAVADKVLAALDDEVAIEGKRLSIDCSVGVATAEAGVDSADELMRNADFAMYMAKGRGKNCVEVFAPSMHLAMQIHSDFKRDLARAADQDQLVLHHQPILDLATGRVLGVEALVRWQHPTRGMVPPNDFIGLAEETGDIVGIGRWVLAQACADLAQYRRDHGQPDLWMSVNVSPLQLIDPTFVDLVLQVLSQHDLPARSLILEITEQAAVTSPAVVNEVLEALRAQGVRIALDDFGVGFSSLRYLRELPVDLIKIDRSFVIDTGDKGDSMLGAIVSLANRMALTVIAEGIEQPEQLRRLQRLGSLAGQGYLFARPMPIEHAAMTLPDAAAHCLGSTPQPAPQSPPLPGSGIHPGPALPAVPVASSPAPE